MYGFLSQVIPCQDSDLELLYSYLRFLLTKLPKRETGPGYHLEEEVELQYYRLQKISEGQIDLNTGDGKPLKGPSDVGTGQEDPEIKLSELIDLLNERFGTDFTQADQLFFDQIQEEAVQSELLKKAAVANSKAHRPPGRHQTGEEHLAKAPAGRAVVSVFLRRRLPLRLREGIRGPGD